MTQININPNPNHVPRKFSNGSWSCCARTHSRPTDGPAEMITAYEALYPHVTEWDDDIADHTTEILFGIAAGPVTTTRK